MPNGGNDCCLTCRFNSNHDEASGGPGSRGRGVCTIRDLDVSDDPLHTYCVNHQAHNPAALTFPVGPVTRATMTASIDYERVVWLESPDTPELRDRVLSHVEVIEPDWSVDFVQEDSLDVAAIHQLAQWGERRALPTLRRLAASERHGDPPVPDHYPHRSAARIVAAAREALAVFDVDGAPDLT